MTAANAATAIRAFTPVDDAGETQLWVQVGEGDYRAVCGVARSVGLVLLLTRALGDDERVGTG